MEGAVCCMMEKIRRGSVHKRKYIYQLRLHDDAVRLLHL